MEINQRRGVMEESTGKEEATSTADGLQDRRTNLASLP